MLPVSEISQVGVVVEDIGKAMDNYWKIFGWGPWQTYTYAPPDLKEMTVKGEKSSYSMKLALYDVGNIQFELMEPLSGPSIYKEHLDNKGEGLHHFANFNSLKDYDTFEAHKRMLEENNIKVCMSGRFDETRFYYYDTEELFGGAIYETVIKGPKREPGVYTPGDAGIEPPELSVREISQIALVVKDLYITMDNFKRILGWGPWDIYDYSPSMKFALYNLDNVQIELIEQNNGPSTPYKDQLKTKGEGLNHIASYGMIKDHDMLKKHQDELEANGLKLVHSGPIDGSGYYYDYDTRELLGGIIYQTGIIEKIPQPDNRYPR